MVRLRFSYQMIAWRPCREYSTLNASELRFGLDTEDFLSDRKNSGADSLLVCEARFMKQGMQS